MNIAENCRFEKDQYFCFLFYVSARFQFFATVMIYRIEFMLLRYCNYEFHSFVFSYFTPPPCINQQNDHNPFVRVLVQSRIILAVFNLGFMQIMLHCSYSFAFSMLDCLTSILYCCIKKNHKTNKAISKYGLILLCTTQ